MAATQFITIKNKNELLTYCESEKMKTVMAIFSNQWCQPCKTIKTLLRKECNKYPNIVFLEIDTETEPDNYNISSFPTIHVIKNGRLVDQIQGFNADLLNEYLVKYN